LPVDTDIDHHFLPWRFLASRIAAFQRRDVADFRRAGRSAPPFAVTPAQQVVAVQETSTHTNKCDANNPLVVSKTNSKLAVELGGADQVMQWAHSRSVRCNKPSSRKKRSISSDRREFLFWKVRKSIDFGKINVTDS